MRKNNWRNLFAVGLLATLPLTAAQAESNRIVLVVDGINQVRNLPALVADSQGYFKDEGLLVTMMELRDEAPADEMLADGRADGSVAFYHHTFMTQVAGTPTESVITMGISPALTLMVSERLRDRVHNVADLKGMRIITGGLNSGKTTTANWLIDHAGLKNTDYRALPLAPLDKMAAQLKSGDADAIVAHEPDATLYEQQHAAFRLAEVTSPEDTRRNLGNLFPTTSLYLRNDYVRANPETVQHLVNAFTKSLRFINSHSADEIYAKLPPEALKKAKEYRAVLGRDKPMFQTDGRIDRADAAKLLEIMSELQPKYKSVKLEETSTNQFVE